MLKLIFGIVIAAICGLLCGAFLMALIVSGKQEDKNMKEIMERRKE